MANITDVAELAGVSVATVSRYFRSPEKVAKKSVDKVAAAVKQLNYTPNLLARKFSESRTYTVMLLVPSLNNPFLNLVMQGIEECGRQLGYHFMLVDLSTNAPDATSCYAPEARLVDGIIQMIADLPEDYERLKTQSPIVLLCDCEEESNCPSVAVDDIESTKTILEYLISQGHKDIACLAGNKRSNATTKRLNSYHQVLNDAQLQPNAIIHGDFSLKSGFEAADHFASLENRPTAIFCMSDTMAIGLASGLRKRGIAIPEDISITGFDDIPMTKYMDPPLTTMRQPAKELGAKAMELLVQLLENPHQREHAPASHRLETELIIRESVCAPKPS